MCEIKINDAHLLLQEQSRVQQEHTKLKLEKQLSQRQALQRILYIIRISLLYLSLSGQWRVKYTIILIYSSDPSAAGKGRGEGKVAHNHRESALQAVEE